MTNDLPEKDLKEIELIKYRRALSRLARAVLNYDDNMREYTRVDLYEQYAQVVALAAEIKEEFEL